ncbi:uncharacterized protein LOC131225593 isoform X1 [Magnolia sinica]|uniref:uncharacterized protein LOC131225593 isoform X1 n=1 Tax=Magnolia sinica TaxID=86752 RepID=UPI002657B142|nr:uncharacterized protein LOC131225593 isoform X1 [Magnolia sinica]
MAMALSCKQIQSSKISYLIPAFSRFFSKSNPSYIVKVGIPEFLTGIGRGVESHVPKLEAEIGDFQKLLVTRTLKLKKLGIPCKHRAYDKRLGKSFETMVESLRNCTRGIHVNRIEPSDSWATH